MLLDDYNPIIFAISLVLGYVCWKRFTQITANKTLGDWLIERKIAKWKQTKESPIAYDNEPVRNKQYKFFGATQDGITFLLEINSTDTVREAYFVLKLKDGSIISSRENQSITADIGEASGFAIGNLWLEILGPYTKWRITFNGSLKVHKPADTQNDAERHVVFTIFWNAASDPIEWPLNWNEQLLSRYLAGDHASSHVEMALNELSQAENGFDQFGSLRGQLTIEHEHAKDVTAFNLPGARVVRSASPTQASDDVHSMIGVCRDGLVYTLHGRNVANHQNIVFSGAVRTPDLHVRCIQSAKSDLLESIDDAQCPIETSIQTSKRDYKLRINKSFEPIPTFTNHGIKSCFPLDVDDQPGVGVILTKVKRSPNAQASANQSAGVFAETAKFNPNLLTVEFTEAGARNEQLSGGKGASLAYLTQLLTKSGNANNFSVPNGFILTSNAFKTHIKRNKPLGDAIANIASIAHHRTGGSLDEACVHLEKLFKHTPIGQEIGQAVEVAYSVLEKHASGELKLAVRSSAVGEDSAELSSAGQNESFLGLSYLDEVLRSIQMCWASLYTVQSVKYRVQNAKPVVTEMATVVQEMVAADCAGVMFTRHPVSNNPSQMLVTANYGLGESVVSGLVDPDIFIVHHSNANNNFSIVERKLGEKSHFVHMTPDDITSSSGVPVELQNKLCVADDKLLELCEIGIFLQDSYGSPRDIEWAIYKEKIYLLQSRPMTSLNAFTSWELLHEFDTVIMSDDDLHTFGNVGEVMPVAFTPLTTAVIQSLELGMRQNFPNPIDSKCYNHIMAISHHRLAMPVFNVFMQVVKEDVTMENKVHSLTVFGHEFITDEIHQIARHRYGLATKMLELQSMWTAFKYAWGVKKSLATVNAFMDDFVGTYDHKNARWVSSAKALHADITTRLGDDFLKVTSVHGGVTMLSVVYQIITFSMLSGKSKEVSGDLLSDITTILTECKDAESAEIPVLLEAIASAIVECGTETAEEFCRVRPNEGGQWLDANCSVAYKLFEIFIEKNKHRGFQEFDLGYETWGMNPSLVIEMLQNNVRNQRYAEKAKKVATQRTPEQIIDSLKSDITSGTKRALRFFLPRCQSYVQHRERTKSLLIAYVHELRKAYGILAILMQRDGLLPDTNLIYHLTHQEIGQVLDDQARSFLIGKAMRRRRFYAEWKKLEFEEFSWGVIKPKNLHPGHVADASKTVKGTPVHEGAVTGRACVCKSFADVSKIQAGDILIARSTDVAWSPYFPILSGVVTELGGLISHGAVVAREYGLPAIVGASNATDIIPDGEPIFMDATAGTITCVKDLDKK